MDDITASFNKAARSISLGSAKMVLSMNGEMVHDIQSSPVSKSTKVKRARQSVRSSDDLSWRKAELTPDEQIRNFAPRPENSKKTRQGHYGFYKDRSTPKYIASTQNLKVENKSLLPHTVVNIIPVLATVDKMQKIIDEINIKSDYIQCEKSDCCSGLKKNHEDPHRCSRASPCDLIVKRMADGKIDYRWGLHVYAIDYEHIIASDRVPQKDDESLIGPSWHSIDKNRWFDNFIEEYDLTKCNIPFPLHSYDLSILRHATIIKHFEKLAYEYKEEIETGKKMYVLVNLFGKDRDEVSPDKFQKETLQLNRGRVESIDQMNAGITFQTKFPSHEMLEKSAKIAVCRETFEETDKIINIDPNDKRLELIGDFEQPNIRRCIRIMVFCWNEPTNIKNIICKNEKN